MGETALLCAECRAPNYPNSEVCWKCGKTLRKFEQPAPPVDASASQLAGPSPEELQRYAVLAAAVPDDEVVRRFRAAWTRQLFIAPAHAVVLLIFFLAREFWGGALDRIPGTAIVWGLIALYIAIAFVDCRCPRCGRRFMFKNLSKLTTCQRCGAPFRDPEELKALALDRPRRFRSLRSTDRRIVISRLVSWTSVGAMWLFLIVFQLSQSSSLLSLAPPLAAAPGTTADATVPQLTIYEDATQGFGFKYPVTWERATVAAADESNLVGRGAVEDPEGNVRNGRCTDFFAVYVVKLPIPLTPASYQHVERKLEKSWLKSLHDVKLLEPWQEISRGGSDGFEVSITYEDAGTPMVRAEAFLFLGDLEYELVAHTARQNWLKDKPAVDAFFASFAPGSSA